MKRPVTITSILIVIVFTFAAFQQCYRIGFEQIKIWDESSGARNAVEMLTGKHYLVVHHNGKPEHYDVKPPFALWLKVLSYKIFGINEFAVRFPTILAAWMTMIFFIVFFIKWIKSPETALVLLFIVASTNGFMEYHVARHGDPDTLLILFVTGYFLCFFMVLEKFPKQSFKYLTATGFFAVLAVYTKSVAGLAPLAGMAAYALLIPKGRRLLSKPAVYLTAAGGLILIMAYYLGRELMDHGYLQNVFRNEMSRLYSYPGQPKHPSPNYYYKYLTLIGFRSWIILLPLLIIPLVFSKDRQKQRLIIYSITSAAVYLTGQSFTLTKNEWYIAPIYPFLWTALAVSLFETLRLLYANIKPLFLKYIVTGLFISIVTYSGINEYIRIFNKNYQKPGGYIYEPERPGHYLKHIKEEHPEVKNLVALTQVYPRQLEFYEKKYAFEDSTSVEIIRDLNQDVSGKMVFVVDSTNRKRLLSAYRVSLIDSAKYGTLYLVGEPKDSLPTVKQNH